jgi:putative ABC transport system permease protein
MRLSLNFLELRLQDIRFATRMLRKSPVFTTIAILTLALGIGANASIFTLINALMLRTLPVHDPGQLVELLHRFPGEPQVNGFSRDAYQLMRDRNDVFSGLIADAYQPFFVRSESSEPESVVGGYVDGTFFHVLGLKPTIGRLIGPEDDRMGQTSAVAVASWSYWKNKFNLDPTILGKQIVVGETPVTVVGVAPRSFLGLSHELSQDVWLPLAMEPVIGPGLARASLTLVGRLRPGVSIEQAQAEMAVLFRSAIEVASNKPSDNPFLRKMRFELEPAGTGLTSPLRQQAATPLFMLMAMVSVLLLITCTNVASLLLARGAARQHEMAVRVSLGAGRLRLLGLVLTESLLLSVAGSLFGIALAYFGAGALVRIFLSGRRLPGLPAHFELHFQPDLHMLTFTTAVALLTGLLFGLAPAMRALSTAPASRLRKPVHTGESGFRRLFGKSLVIAQVALSVTLLSAAALFIGYLSNLEHLNLGFRRDHLLLVSLDPTHSSYQSAQFSYLCQELLAQLEAIPGVRSATLSAKTPISGSGASGLATFEGYQERPEDRRHLAINWIAPNYFETYGIPLLAGREFSLHDQGGPRVAVINRAMARDYFAGRSPIGGHVTLDHSTSHGDDNSYEIVGVVGDTAYNEIREVSQHSIYLNVFQDGRTAWQLTLRTASDSQSVAPEVSRAAAASLRGLTLARVTTMADQVDASIVPERLMATLSGWFATLAALLAAIGLYGLLAYTVTRRTNEIGIRMALGATRSNVVQMVLRDALGMVCAGVAMGVPLALWGKRIAVTLIQDLPANYVLPIALGAVAMFVVVLLAAYFPARKAARVDPMVALRFD